MRDRWREGGIQRRPTFYEGAGGTAGKVYRAEGRKEGRSYAATRRGVRGKRHGRGGWELAFSV